MIIAQIQLIDRFSIECDVLSTNLYQCKTIMYPQNVCHKLTRLPAVESSFIFSFEIEVKLETILKLLRLLGIHTDILKSIKIVICE